MAASYPGAVVIFPVRANGQTIDASHVNSLQDEVTALESGLLTGTANLQSSHTTVATLRVLTNSTVVGTLTVGGDITGNSSLTVVKHAAFGASVRISSNTTIVGTLTVGGNITVNSTLTIVGGITGLGPLMLSASTSITLADGNTDNLAIGSDVFQVRLTGNSSVSTLTGFATAGDQARVLFVVNVGTAQIGLGHATGSVSSNRFQLPHSADHALNIADGALFVYDPISACWRTALSP